MMKYHLKNHILGIEMQSKYQLEVKTLQVKPLENSVFKKSCMEDLPEERRSKIKLSILLPNIHFHI